MCFEEIRYAGTNLKEAQKLQQPIYIYKDGKMCGWMNYESGKWVK
jgi:predicted nucleic-acid-binding Zn-ribbon protein